MDSLNNTDFKKLASQQKTIQMKVRLLALAHFKESHSRTQIAKYLKVSRTSVNKWVQAFLEEGLEGLNPIEQVWSWLRQHYLANQSFTDYNDIVSKVCRAWNGFLECKDRVTKMSRRDWINLIS